MDDLISRQAAIDGLDVHYIERRNLNDWQAGWNAALDWMKDVYLDELPSSHPDLSSYSDKLWRSAYERGKAEAQAEIIRCRDCKYRDPEDKKCDCGHGIVWNLPRQDDWFCADAKRRTDGTEQP